MVHLHPGWLSGEFSGEWRPKLAASGTSTDAAVLAAETADAAEQPWMGQAPSLGRAPDPGGPSGPRIWVSGLWELRGRVIKCLTVPCPLQHGPTPSSTHFGHVHLCIHAGCLHWSRVHSRPCLASYQTSTFTFTVDQGFISVSREVLGVLNLLSGNFLIQPLRNVLE